MFMKGKGLIVFFCLGVHRLTDLCQRQTGPPCPSGRRASSALNDPIADVPSSPSKFVTSLLHRLVFSVHSQLPAQARY